MKYRIKSLLIPILLFNFLFSHANDGAFRASGNQLIPMYETDISVKKEILTIRRINATQARIEVYYEFFNPKAPKDIEVGFEATSPSGDDDHTPEKDGQQPYISDFTVTMNGAAVPFKVAIVHDKIYYRNGQYKSISVAKATKDAEEEDYVDFLYVYHFHAMFKQGLNIIRHVYVVDLSTSVDEKYSLDYILTAAKRWANRQIDDFTLQIDMGDFQDFCIQNTFFVNLSEWKMDSTVKSLQIKNENTRDKPDNLTEFFIRKGMITFAKKDFRPGGELYIQSFSNYHYRDPVFDKDGNPIFPEKFDSKKQKLPFSIELQEDILPPADDLSRKILHNLPFARRGYVFKSPELASYYEGQRWYLPDPTYSPVVTQLTQKERDWLKK